VPGLPHDGVDDVEAGDLVLWLALLYEFLHALHHVLVELDSFDGAFCYRGHFRLGDRRPSLVQRGQLLVK